VSKYGSNLHEGSQKSFIVSLSKRDNKDETKEPTKLCGGHAKKEKMVVQTEKKK
jgi:hypothetical protein